MADTVNDLRAIRSYWTSPTAGDKAKAAAPGLVEYAQTTIYGLCDEVEKLRDEIERRRLVEQAYKDRLDDVVRGLHNRGMTLKDIGGV